MTGMRVLVLGADVTLLARGRRLADLRKQGVILEDRRTGGPANGPGQRFPSRPTTTALSDNAYPPIGECA